MDSSAWQEARREGVTMLRIVDNLQYCLVNGYPPECGSGLGAIKRNGWHCMAHLGEKLAGQEVSHSEILTKNFPKNISTEITQ